MLQLLNEPQPNHNTLITHYYPNAYLAIRSVEAALRVPHTRALTIQMMDATWGAGDPHQHQHLPQDARGVALDNHRYLAYSSTRATKAEYLRASCSDAFLSREDNKPLVVGEWSLAVKQEKEWSDGFSPVKKGNHDWYRQWWAAQVQAYEKQEGWVFWSWKTELGEDWRWSYSAAVEMGVIPKDFSKIQELAQC